MPPYRLLFVAIIIAVVCGVEVIGTPAHVADAAPVQTCTSQNSQGFPVSGEVCSGSSHALLCSAGAIYLPGCSPRSMQSHQGIELYGHGIRYG